MSENRLSPSHGQELTLKQPESQPSLEEIVAKNPELGLILGVMASLKAQTSSEAYQMLLADMAQLLQDFAEGQNLSASEQEVGARQTLWQRVKTLFRGKKSLLNPVSPVTSPQPVLVNNSEYDARGKRRQNRNGQHENHDEEHREARKMAGLSSSASFL